MEIGRRINDPQNIMELCCLVTLVLDTHHKVLQVPLGHLELFDQAVAHEHLQAEVWKSPLSKSFLVLEDVEIPQELPVGMVELLLHHFANMIPDSGV